MKPSAALMLAATCAFTAACATPPAPDRAAGIDDRSPDHDLARQNAPPPERDLEAIRAMIGEFRVDFRFRDTVVLDAGFEPSEPHDSGGYEVVLEIEDGDDIVRLQHLLVGPGGRVIKHWRQDWSWEAPERLEHAGPREWRQRTLAPDETRGRWTQCVWEVNDAPRYCGTGAWAHEGGVSTWESDRAWRPLPRRELGRSDSYDVLAAVNRHTITPDGWTHEQDNTKLRVHFDGDTIPVAREHGVNHYRRHVDHDFSPAYAYWERTRDYWAEVRAQWDALIARHGGVYLAMDIDGMPLIQALFELAEEGGGDIDEHEIATRIAARVRAPDER